MLEMLFRGRFEVLEVFEVGGMEFLVVQSERGKGTRISIVTKCPKCGKFGRLVRLKERKVIDSMRFAIFHPNGYNWGKRCYFGSLSDESEVFAEVYRSVRRG